VSTRRRLVPEVVQTSAMDCGPACLAAVLGGFGRRASYGRLREACQTDVDGTSIDTIEEIARELGLDAAQVLVPVDHVLLAESDALPAIAVTRQPGGDNHFVVLWGQTGGRVQLMDPAVGRRWMPARALLADLYVHEMELPVETWRAWAGSDDMTGPLARRLPAVGARDPGAEIQRALADPGWRDIARLDAATRMVQSVIDAGGLSPGVEAAALVRRLADGVATAIPDEYWSAREASDDHVVRARGAVLVHVSGIRTDAPPPRSRELAAALDEPRPRPWRALRDAIVADGGWRIGALIAGLVLAALGTVGEVALFRAMFELDRDLATWPQLAAAMGTLLAVLIALALIEVPLQHLVTRLGRHVEVRLRVGFLAKLPRLGLAYLRSRPRSDLAERAHLLHQLRELPPLGARALRIVVEVGATAAALIWLAPSSAPWVLALVGAVLIPPLLVQPALQERDLRVRTHAGALARFHLDALLGVVPVRTHGVERALRREHEGKLVEWVRAARAELRVVVTATALQAVLTFAVAIALVMIEAQHAERPAAVLLLAFWAMSLPWAGLELTALVRELPGHRNLTLRMLEPLGALEEEPAIRATRDPGPVGLELRDVTVVAGGHPILHELTLSIAPGEHVAIVGRSGSGKSSLLGLWLGWVRPASGELVLDGTPADRDAIAALRPRTAWVDPAIHLWNASLADNLAYAAPDADVGAASVAAGLEDVMARLPEGLGTALGEAGGLVSGGEAQRVRFGRAAAAAEAPSLVLLDEPFRGLDRHERARMLSAARTRWAGCTMLCATHDLGGTQAFPRVIVLDGGRIVEDGTPAALRAEPTSHYARLIEAEGRAAAAWSRWRRVTLARGVVTEAP